MPDEKPQKPIRLPKQNRDEEAKKVVQEYMDDQRGIREKLRRKLD